MYENLYENPLLHKINVDFILEMSRSMNGFQGHTSSVDYEQDLIVVSCASGKQATALLPHLTTKFQHLRLVCHSSNSAERLRNTYPKAEILQTDLNDPGAAAQIVRNATAIYHVEPPFAHLQASIGIRLIDAAVAELKRPSSRFKHFVYASVLNTELGKVRSET